MCKGHVCLFVCYVCLFVCLLACLCVCLFALLVECLFCFSRLRLLRFNDVQSRVILLLFICFSVFCFFSFLFAPLSVCAAERLGSMRLMRSSTTKQTSNQANTSHSLCGHGNMACLCSNCRVANKQTNKEAELLVHQLAAGPHFVPRNKRVSAQ